MTGCGAKQEVSEALKQAGSRMDQRQDIEESEQLPFETEYVSEDIEQQTDELTESDKIILEYKYAELLAKISLGGKWPEENDDENYHEELSEINVSDNEPINYYAIIDSDRNGKEHLLIKTSDTFKDYSVDLQTGELSENDFTYSDTDIEWIELKADNYRGYTDKYIQYLLEGMRASNPGDIGICFIRSGWDSQELIEQVAEETDAMFLQLEEGYYEGTCEGESVFVVDEIDGMSLEYKDTAIDGVSLLGIAPGMNKNKAQETLESLGFYRSENEEMFITGQSLGNYSVYLNIDYDIVREIIINHYNAYILDF